MMISLDYLWTGQLSFMVTFDKSMIGEGYGIKSPKLLPLYRLLLIQARMQAFVYIFYLFRR